MATTAGKLALESRPVDHRSGATDVMLLVMASIWGVNYSVIKFATQIFPPLVFNGLRIPLASGVQLGLAEVRRQVRVAPGDRWRLIVLGMLGNGVYQVFFILGVARTRVATAALVMAATPAIVAVMGWLHGSETVSSRAWTGIALQVAGMASVVLGTAGSPAGTDSLLGVGSVLLGATAWAGYSILIRPYSSRIPPLQLGGYTMLGGAIVAVTTSIPFLRSVAWLDTTPLVWLALTYSALGALVLAYAFWYRGVHVIGPTRTAMYSNLQPLIAMIVAWLALAEQPTPWQLVGAACIMSGLVLARTQPLVASAPACTPD